MEIKKKLRGAIDSMSEPAYKKVLDFTKPYIHPENNRILISYPGIHLYRQSLVKHKTGSLCVSNATVCPEVGGKNSIRRGIYG
jgi:hypothetical protein